MSVVPVVLLVSDCQIYTPLPRTQLFCWTIGNQLVETARVVVTFANSKVATLKNMYRYTLIWETVQTLTGNDAGLLSPNPRPLLINQSVLVPGKTSRYSISCDSVEYREGNPKPMDLWTSQCSYDED